MNIDKQRISAVATLQNLEYVWDGVRWSKPTTLVAPPLSEKDLDLLSGTICRYFSTSSDAIRPLINEIRTWRWFR